MSHVKVSFEMAEYTGNVDALGTLRLLEAIRIVGLTKTVRFYQASTRYTARGCLLYGLLLLFSIVSMTKFDADLFRSWLFVVWVAIVV